MSCTALKGRVISTDDWRRQHAGHDVEEWAQTVSVKRLRWLRCNTCSKQHLFSMEDIAP